jgi:hypothetical protein
MNPVCLNFYNSLLSQSYKVYTEYYNIGMEVVNSDVWNTFVNIISNLPQDCVTVFRGIDRQSDIYNMNELLNENVELVRRIMNFITRKWKHMEPLQFGKRRKSNLKQLLMDINYLKKK